jgi:hypothetical protein
MESASVGVHPESVAIDQQEVSAKKNQLIIFSSSNFRFLLLSQDNYLYVTSAIDYNWRVDVVLVKNVNLMSRSHDQMPISQFPFYYALGKVQTVIGSGHNVLQFQCFTPTCNCLQVLISKLSLNNVDFVDVS